MDANQIDARPLPVWHEKFFWILLSLTALFYLPRLASLSVCGEESRWATVAREMLASGDWIVPRQQGNVFPERPPLGSWLMMVVGFVRGDIDLWAIRLPSVLAVLATVAVIYWYARRFLSALGALTAGLAYATMGQVLQLGRQGESEAVFSCLLATSLLVWHANYRQKRLYSAWMVGAAVAGIAALTKGIQAPVYFVLVTNVWCLVRRDWRAMFSLAQLSGLAMGFTVILLWLLPFWSRTSAHDVAAVWCGLAGDRFSLAGLAKHLISYPLETLVCTLPWSLALLPLVAKKLRDSLGDAASWARDLAIANLVTYPTVLIASGARGRYFMPLYPLLAILAAIAIESLLRHREKAHTRLTLGLACGCGLIYLGPVMQSRMAIENDIRADVARLSTELPADAKLVSFGPIAHRFSYTYPAPITELAWPASDDVTKQVEYFCFDQHPEDTPEWRCNGRGRTWGLTPATLPFGWEEIDRVPCDPRTRGERSVNVIIGRVRRDASAVR
jgi:4-amino-4-deoxy-L-arabinose transferase-like glycosyltransferase